MPRLVRGSDGNSEKHLCCFLFTRRGSWVCSMSRLGPLLAVLGRPGTEAPLFARLLSARLRAVETVSVRAAAAAEISHNTHLGMQIAARAANAAEAGCLLPSSLVAPLVQPRLQRVQAMGGTCILSNFPRTADQLRMLQHFGLPAPQVLNLELSRPDAERRVADRRVCESCGEPMYPIPAVVGAPGGLHAHLVESECDAPAPRREVLDLGPALTRRLDAFDEHTVPLLHALRGRGAVHDITLGSTAQATWDAVLAACGLPPDD